MVEPIFDYQFRVILIGDSTVGKSSLLKFFTEGRFDECCDPTVGVDFFARLIEVKAGVRIKLQIWDTAGQERFKSITRSYYRNSAAVFLVYDITKRKSFEHLDEWLDESRIHILPHKAVYIVIGHKADDDANRVVSTREGRQFAEARGFQFLETSARTGQNIEEAFLSVSSDVYTLIEKGCIRLEEGWEGVKMGYSKQGCLAGAKRGSCKMGEEVDSSGGCC